MEPLVQVRDLHVRFVSKQAPLHVHFLARLKWRDGRKNSFARKAAQPAGKRCNARTYETTSAVIIEPCAPEHSLSRSDAHHNAP